jgi:hypothetical protein
MQSKKLCSEGHTETLRNSQYILCKPRELEARSIIVSQEKEKVHEAGLSVASSLIRTHNDKEVIGL